MQQQRETVYHFSRMFLFIVQESEGIGCGYHDDLFDIYYSIEWIMDEEDLNGAFWKIFF